MLEENLPTSLHHRKKDRTRATLEQAAIELGFAKGFENTTIDEIASKAGVSSRTFFRYFNTKEDALFPNVEDDLEATKMFLAGDHKNATSVDILRRVIRTIADTFSKDFLGDEFKRNKVILASESLMSRQMQNKRKLQTCLAEGLARANVDPLFTDLVAAASVAALTVAIETWVEGDAQENLADLVVRTFEYLRAGLLVEPVADPNHRL